METQFSFFNYFLMLLSIFSHYSLGRRIVKSSFITNCLVGLAGSALVVGSFANICAGLIRPYILFSIIIGGILFLFDAIKFFRSKRPFQFNVYLTLLFLGAFLFSLNTPQKALIEKKEQNQTILYFEGHKSYLSGQSIEMLNASYMNRLRVSNAYPHKWTNYHFFNSSTQAIVQGLINHPGLFTYQMAKTLIMILILLSFGEFIFMNYKFSIRTVLLFLFWLTVGFSFFSDSLFWNLRTSGAFSVFAIVHIIFALLSKKYSDAIIFSFILGASVVRLMPVSLLSIIMLISLFYRSRLNKDFIKSFIKKNLLYDILLILFLCYSFLTLFPPDTLFSSKSFFNLSNFVSNNYNMFYLLFIIIILFLSAIGIRFILWTQKRLSLFPENKKKIITVRLFTATLFVYVIIAILPKGDYKIFDPGWLCGISIYKWIGAFSHGIFGTTPFNHFNFWFSDMSWITPGSSIRFYLFVILVVTIVIMLTLSIKSFILSAKKDISFIKLFVHNPYIYMPLLILTIVSLPLSDINNQVFYLNLLVFSYFFLSLLMLYNINNSNRSNNIFRRKKIFIYSFAVQLGSLLWYLLLRDGYTSAVLYIIPDIFLWSIFGIFLFTVKIRRIHLACYTSLFMLSILMGVTFDRVLKETSGQTKVNITPLMNSEFQRDLFVDNNMLILDNKEPMYQDAYAIILGANLLYKEENKFQSYNHILK